MAKLTIEKNTKQKKEALALLYAKSLLGCDDAETEIAALLEDIMDESEIVEHLVQRGVLSDDLRDTV